jgi:hypothetical protein
MSTDTSTRFSDDVSNEDFIEGLRLLRDGAQRLGNTRAAIGLLRVLEASTNGTITDAELDALLLPVPKPRPEPKRSAAPEGFTEKVELGRIAGAVVTGSRTWEEREGIERRWYASGEIHGQEVQYYPRQASDGDKFDALFHFAFVQGDTAGDMRLSDVGRLVEMATDPAQPLAQLRRMTDAWLAELDQPAELRKAA